MRRRESYRVFWEEAGMRILILAVVLNVGFALGFEAQDATIRGWLSDEQCAGGRASGSVYTGTNPECAKQCVAKGAKIVLICTRPEAVAEYCKSTDGEKQHCRLRGGNRHSRSPRNFS